MGEYQKDAVAAYKASPDANFPPQDLWNNTGRGYPDVAALGGQKNPYCVVTDGSFEGVAGTSASCPVVAGGCRNRLGDPRLRSTREGRNEYRGRCRHHRCLSLGMTQLFQLGQLPEVEES